MKKIIDIYILVASDKEALNFIRKYSKKYPTENGYRIETFMSPEYIRIKVYEVDE